MLELHAACNNSAYHCYRWRIRSPRATVGPRKGVVPRRKIRTARKHVEIMTLNCEVEYVSLDFPGCESRCFGRLCRNASPPQKTLIGGEVEAETDPVAS